MVVRANDSMTIDGVQKIAHYARAGLPIFFSSGMPSDDDLIGTYAPSDKNIVSRTLTPLKSLSNVHMVPLEGLANSIASAGITPLTSVSANALWWTYWRCDDVENMDYVFVSNVAGDTSSSAPNSDGTVTFSSAGIPYYFDAWTGTGRGVGKADGKRENPDSCNRKNDPL